MIKWGVTNTCDIYSFQMSLNRLLCLFFILYISQSICLYVMVEWVLTNIRLPVFQYLQNFWANLKCLICFSFTLYIILLLFTIWMIKWMFLHKHMHFCFPIFKNVWMSRNYSLCFSHIYVYILFFILAAWEYEMNSSYDNVLQFSNIYSVRVKVLATTYHLYSYIRLFTPVRLWDYVLPSTHAHIHSCFSSVAEWVLFYTLERHRNIPLVFN